MVVPRIITYYYSGSIYLELVLFKGTQEREAKKIRYIVHNIPLRFTRSPEDYEYSIYYEGLKNLLSQELSILYCPQMITWQDFNRL